MTKHRFIFAATLSAIAIFVWLETGLRPDPSSGRGPASIQDDMKFIGSKQIKTEMIQSLEWVELGDHYRLRVGSSNSQFCSRWNTLKLTLMADGVAVSGEVPFAEKWAQCIDSGFEVLWPKRIQHWPNSEISFFGDFTVEPRAFFIARILIEGPFGQMNIAVEEITFIRNEIFELQAKD